MAIDKLKTKFFTGAWLTDVKHYFVKINEMLDYQTPITLSNDNDILKEIKKSYNAQVTLNDNLTLKLLNLTPGDYGTIVLIQDAVGSRTITLPSNSIVMGSGGSSSITLSTNANYKDIATFYYDGTSIYWTISLY